MTKLYTDKSWLHVEYVTNEKSAEQIANECDVSSQTILNWLAKLDIPTRDKHTRSATKRKRLHSTSCNNCGKVFFVDSPSKADPTNKRHYKRACSPKCTSALISKNVSGRTHVNKGKILGLRTKLNRDELVQLICYEYKYQGEVAKILGVKYATLTRELNRLQVPREFYRTCPQCNEQFTCTMRCQVDPTSNKFKKFCSHACFLKSRSNTDTWIERATSDFLNDNHIEFIPQYSIGRMTADFYIPSINLVVETNGDFWHANPSIYTDKESLHPIQRRAIEKDTRKLRQLHDKGYDVFILWENDLKVSKDEVLAELLSYIRLKHKEVS